MAVQPSRLRFYSRSHALVQDFDKLEAGIKKFIGWKLVQKAPPSDPTNPEDKGTWAFDQTPDEAYEVPNRAEYRQCCKDGELAPADAETAKACGVPFESSKKAPASSPQSPAQASA